MEGVDFSRFEATLYGNVDDDDDLLAELAALEKEEKVDTRRVGGAKAAAAVPRGRGGGGAPPPPMPMKMEEVTSMDDEEDASVEDDDDLLAELSSLVGVSNTPSVPPRASLPPPKKVDPALLAILNQRRALFEQALSESTRSSNEAKQRRCQRAIDTIAKLQEKANAGLAINMEEIPAPPAVQAPASDQPRPPVAPVKPKKPEETKSPQPAPIPTPQKRPAMEEPPLDPRPSSSGKKMGVEEIMRVLVHRRDEYRKNTAFANKAGDKVAALEYFEKAKQFDAALEAVKNGELTECSSEDIPPSPKPYTRRNPGGAPRTLLEALIQRLDKYKETAEAARRGGDERKHRQTTRIVKQYEDAIKDCQKNRPVNVDELPVPPGFPPLPSGGATTGGVPKPAVVAPVPAGRKPVPEIGPYSAAPSTTTAPAQSRQNQQLLFLQQRQLQFKQAALVAKNKGDMVLAKKYLISSKGFDKMIEASQNGLPVDIRKAPVPPQVMAATQGLTPMMPSSSGDHVAGTRAEIYATIEGDLIRQIRLCDENRQFFTSLGDVGKTKLFEGFASNLKKDLLSIRQFAKNNQPPPRFHYETRSLPSLDQCPDLAEDKLEFTIIRVIQAKLPPGYGTADACIFVRYAFPFPHDNNQTGKTKTVSKFNEKFELTINRKQRQFTRIIKRNGLKMEVFQKVGFLRSDKLLGTAECPLGELETKAQLHESLDLVEGKKAVGGKIELRIRIREPLGDKKLSVIQEKWLVIDA